eukprot:m.145842 g.145842  ORF g.145842 m.145842 type:complete len:90 (+) comp30457_c0_seq1:78-347(+)
MKISISSTDSTQNESTFYLFVCLYLFLRLFLLLFFTFYKEGTILANAVWMWWCVVLCVRWLSLGSGVTAIHTPTQETWLGLQANYLSFA